MRVLAGHQPSTLNHQPFAPPPGTGNLAPWDGLQSFGIVDVSADALRVSLVGIDGKPRYAVDLPRS